MTDGFELLLPLRLSSARPADLALVIDRLDRCYKGCTILTVPMAYRNAWLITRPESDWLVVPPTPLTDRAELDEAAAPTWRRVSGVIGALFVRGDELCRCRRQPDSRLLADREASTTARWSTSYGPALDWHWRRMYGLGISPRATIRHAAAVHRKTL